MFMKALFLLFLLFSFNSAQAKDPTLYEVIEAEDEDTLSNMVMLGFDINSKDAAGLTPLMIAAKLNKTDFARFLADNGAEIDLRDKKGQTALHWAAIVGNNKIIKMLLDAGANINMPDLEGYTPMMAAVLAEKNDSVKFLIDQGAYVNFRNAAGATALRIAERKRLAGAGEILKSRGGRY